MNRKLLRAFFIAAVLLLAGTGVTAQSPGPSSPQAPLGSGFTYQGQLKQNGTPVNNICDMAFRLYDAPASGAQIGSPITTTVPVTHGLFTMALDFGAAAFTGEARWLDIQVRCPMNVGNFAALAPRQALTAAPHALSLMPNATINGLNNTGNLSFGNVTRQMLNLWGTEYGIGVQSYTVYNRTDNGGGFAWYEGGSHSNAQNDPGPFGFTQMRLNSSEGLRVNSRISALTNALSPGATILGTNTGSGYGVYGVSASGGGVIGESVTGNGVTGVASGGSGVHGVSTSSNGVQGETSSANASGLFGQNSSGGSGVKGVAGACNAFPCMAFGVQGTSLAGGAGYAGVYGEGDQYGVVGESLFGVGVNGYSASTNGVFGRTTAPAASGVYGENFDGGNGVAGRASGSGTGVLGDNTHTSGYAGYFNGRLHVEGNLEFTGNLIGGNKSGYVSDIAVNASDDVLTAGDVVVVIGHSAPAVGTIPVARVIRASAAYQTGVVGIVDQHVTHGDGVRFNDGPIAPGEYLNVVTLGMYRFVKVDATFGAIHAGDLLVASPHVGYVMKATDRLQAVGAIIGKALGDLDRGTGTVPVIVTLQ